MKALFGFCALSFFSGGSVLLLHYVPEVGVPVAVAWNSLLVLSSVAELDGA